MTLQELKSEMEELVGDSRLATQNLLQALNASQVQLKPYLLWLVHTQGTNKMFPKLVTAVKQYAAALAKEKQSLPQSIVNAGNIFLNVSEGALTGDRSIQLLEDMCEKHVIYFLFAGAGLPCDRYRKAAIEYAGMYPEAVLALPEPYCALGRALVAYDAS